MRCKVSNSFNQAVCAVEYLSADLEDSTEDPALQTRQAWLHPDQDLLDDQPAELPREDCEEGCSRYDSCVLWDSRGFTYWSNRKSEMLECFRYSQLSDSEST